MNDTFSASCAAIANEPIPGYVLETRLGRGGYGQVWKALAPGSLYKAVKIVHGYHNDELAMRELQALERIKQVRHPFLLSIERIEISDGQLVIVTELAEMSLRDQFDEHRLCGEPGIPRPELLRHLGDVADALDFISQRHGLQHLDIKPENLLVVGDRLKVGDFGLVNDLQQVNSSLMSTLTPVYAPPELFNGRPHLHSDQYSLAIVYQEMLTGQRPFDGTTAAQLASQHLMDPPNLSSLPTSDREVLARALAKNPELRFESCRQLIDQLLDVNVPDEIASDNCLGNGGAGVEFADVSTLVEAPHIYSSVDVPAAMAAGASRDDTGKGGTGSRPPAAGNGTSGRLLATDACRRSWWNRRSGLAPFPPATRRPIWRHCLARGVSPAVCRHGPKVGRACLHWRRTVGARPPGNTLDAAERTQDYGGDKNKFLRWLSRRWLYNIPRSLKTEGRRPLGRVALVDHVDELLERLRGAIREMTDTETLTTSGETVGGQFERTSPRVFIVASAAGGTGGGMVVDVAYAVRQVLREQALEDGGVHGLLTFSTPRDPEARQLATANAIATLLEINHLSHRDTEYPGADECELAAAKTGDPSFSSLSFLHLGDALSEDELARSIEQLAEYMYLDATSPAGAFFNDINNTARKAAPLDPELVPVRTFKLHPHGTFEADLVDIVTDEISRGLIAQWAGPPTVVVSSGLATTTGASDSDAPANGDDASSTSASRENASRDGDLHDLTARGDGMADQFVRQQTIAFALDTLVEQFVASAHLKLDESPEDLAAGLSHDKRTRDPLGVVDRLVGSVDHRGGAIRLGDENCVVDAIIAEAQSGAKERGQALRGDVARLVDNPEVRILGAREVATRLRRWFESTRQHAEKLLQHAEVEVTQAPGGLPAPGTGRLKLSLFERRRDETTPSRAERLRAYINARIKLVAVAGAIKTLRTLSDAMLPTIQDVANVTRCLDAVVDRIGSSSGNASDNSASHAPASTTDEAAHGLAARLSGELHVALSEQQNDLVRRLDEAVRQDWLDARGGLASLVDVEPPSIDELAAAVARHARAIVTDAIIHLDVAGKIVRLAGAPEYQDDIHSWLCGLQPPALDVGGARAFLLASGAATDGTPLQELVERETGGQCSMIAHPDAGLALVCCGEQLSLAGIVRWLAREPGIVEIATQLHTRIDVPWKSI